MMSLPTTLLHRMRYDPLERMRQWHRKFGIKPFIEAKDENDRYQIRLIRATLILEEACEVIEELGFEVNLNEVPLLRGNKPTSYEGLAKELADLKVVTYGTDEVFDIPAEVVFNEVMRSNFSKLGEDGKPVYREDGKVLKGSQYKEPDIRGALTGEWL